MTVNSLLGTVTFGPSLQTYYAVSMTGGSFGTGTGPEMASSADSDIGSYEPVWIALGDLADVDVRPASLASMLVDGLPLPPFSLVESDP